MGLIRKVTSLSTLGAVDFKSDKERIANSTRKGMKAQKKMLDEMRKGNRIASAAQAPAPQVAAPAPIAAPILSPDGNFWWDGTAWQPMPGRPQN